MEEKQEEKLSPEVVEAMKKAQEARVASANAEIDAVLKRYGVTLHVVQSIVIVPSS